MVDDKRCGLCEGGIFVCVELMMQAFLMSKACFALFGCVVETRLKLGAPGPVGFWFGATDWPH